MIVGTSQKIEYAEKMVFAGTSLMLTILCFESTKELHDLQQIQQP